MQEAREEEEDEERSRQEVSQERSLREVSEVGKKTRRESGEEEEKKKLEEREKKLEEDREAAESWLEEIRRQQRETRGRLIEMRRKFEPKEAVTTATGGSDDEEAAITTNNEASKCEVYQKAAKQSCSWCRGGKAKKQKRKDRMGWFSVSASEEEEGGREASVEVPLGIMVERERNEEKDTKRTDNLVATVQKLEEQMR